MNQHSYTKQELALLYFPDATPEVASAHLRRWIILCEPLYEQLLKTGYSKWAKGFTPTQVSYIVYHHYSVPTILQVVTRFCF